MGDRALVQFVCGTEFSPVIYLHWSGSEVPGILTRTAHRMRDRASDVSYVAARFIQDATAADPDGGLSFGVWNAERILQRDDSHGDAGIILVQLGPLPWRVIQLGASYPLEFPGPEVIRVNPDSEVSRAS